MNQNLAPNFEDLNSPALDVPQAIGELAVTTYGEGVAEQTTVLHTVRFDSSL